MASGWSCGENGHLTGYCVTEYLIILQNLEGQEYLALQNKQKTLSFPTKEQERLFVGDEWKHLLFRS